MPDETREATRQYADQLFSYMIGSSCNLMASNPRRFGFQEDMSFVGYDQWGYPIDVPTPDSYKKPQRGCGSRALV